MTTTTSTVEKLRKHSMRIGVIGSGMIGGTAARLFAEAGHEVMVANSRGSDSLTELVSQIGHGVRAGNVEAAARFGELVLIAIPFGRYRELPAQALADKVVMDAMNYYPQRDGAIHLVGGSSQTLAAFLRMSQVVKAFNTLNYRVLGSPRGPSQEPLVLFLAGDDRQAKRLVSSLIRDIGFVPIDTGSLAEGDQAQSTRSPIYNRALTQQQADGTLALIGPRPPV